MLATRLLVDTEFEARDEGESLKQVETGKLLTFLAL